MKDGCLDAQLETQPIILPGPCRSGVGLPRTHRKAPWGYALQARLLKRLSNVLYSNCDQAFLDYSTSIIDRKDGNPQEETLIIHEC